jgi:hypothetical protein
MEAPDSPPPDSETGDRASSGPPGDTAAVKLSWMQVALMVAGLVGLGAIVFALYLHFSDLTGWPEAYGIECRRKCWGTYLFHSPRLLLHNDLNEFALFAVLWAVVWVPALVLFPISKQLRARKRLN